tara:strand:- start:5 stop:307 length:303 start_codon:yes stop_codon:yes gene_type:complete
MIIVYVVCKDRKEARKISSHLLSKRLAACTNVFAIDSFFLWKGKQEKEKEVAMIVKTTQNLFNRVEKAILKVHSYDIPCIMKIPVSCNAVYDDWMQSTVR